jgi:hypothetical protein
MLQALLQTAEELLNWYPDSQEEQVVFVKHVLQFLMEDRQFWIHKLLFAEIVDMLSQIKQVIEVRQVKQLLI